ncbi:hypothetical protein CEXT_463581 [Caerostris extrusa]|uniref:Uncharacterized protein n=1 Tax=Caerostris extrusa TaxID=172846 RepID=A0AAV4UPY4_CAEEX|nr:hypothetical protein CEXT_463581 [Caerostris extrusa]
MVHVKEEGNTVFPIAVQLDGSGFHPVRKRSKTRRVGERKGERGEPMSPNPRTTTSFRQHPPLAPLPLSVSLRAKGVSFRAHYRKSLFFFIASDSESRTRPSMDRGDSNMQQARKPSPTFRENDPIVDPTVTVTLE